MTGVRLKTDDHQGNRSVNKEGLNLAVYLNAITNHSDCAI